MAWYHKVFPSGWFAEKYLQQGNANLSLATLSIWLGGYEGAILGIIVSQVVLSQPIETNATAREFLTFSAMQDGHPVPQVAAVFSVVYMAFS